MNKQLFAQTAPPPLRGRGRGCGAERRQWRMQRGGAPVAVEKIEQASSAKIFSGTARRRGQIRRGYLWSASVRSTDLFFPIIEGKTIFVSSTAKRQRGLQRGKLGSPLPCFASFCRSKRKAPAASGVNYAFAKGSTPPIGDHKLSPAGQAHSLGLCKRPRPAGRRNENMPRQKDRKSSCHSGTGALFAGVNGEHQTALSTLPERKQRVQA